MQRFHETHAHRDVVKEHVHRSFHDNSYVRDSGENESTKRVNDA
jgi:hypothetical protein